MNAEALKSSQNYHHGNVKTEILAVAKKILETERVQNLSLRRLAKEVGVTATAVYNYFSDKDAIIMAIKMDLFQTFYEVVFPQETLNLDPERRLAEASYNYFLYSRNYPSHFELLFNYHIPPANVTEEFIQCACRSEKILREVVRALYEKYQIPCDEDVLIKSVLAIWTQLHGLVTLINNGSLKATVIAQSWPQRFTMTEHNEVQKLLDDFVQQWVTTIRLCDRFQAS